MADLIRKMQEGHTVEDIDTVIDEVYEARGEYDSLDERLDDMSSGTPAPASSTPSMDGTGSAGTADTYARGDHTHPTDTSRHPKIDSSHKLSADLVDDTSTTNKFATETELEQIETNKNNILYNTDNGVKNVVNFNTNLPTTTIKGITFTDNHNSTINVDGTSTDADAYVQLYNVNSDNLFGFKIGETVVITSTSNTVALQIIPKRTGGYGATVFGTKLSPAIYTIPSNFTGFLLRVGVIATGTHVDNEDVSGMICLKSLYDADPTYQPYAMSNAELTAAIQAIQAQLANQ